MELIRRKKGVLGGERYENQGGFMIAGLNDVDGDSLCLNARVR